MKTLDEIILRSKEKLASTFFKIEKQNDSFIIKEYIGPKKSFYKMHVDGWKRFDSLIDEINASYPVFNINDFKAINENEIVKKTDQDFLAEELTKYLKYLDLSNDLCKALKGMKELLIALSIKFMEFKSFTDLQNHVTGVLNSNRLDGSKYLNLFIKYTNDIYFAFEKLEISNPRQLFDNKFNFFLALIK
jgi:hypothetical protein